MDSTPSSIGSFRAPRLEHARVQDAMHPGVLSCAPETPLRDVARILARRHIHCLVVAGDRERGGSATWGVVSGLDLVGAAAGDLDELTAGEIAATEPVKVKLDDPLARAAQLMVEHQVQHLVVVAADDAPPVGVLSTLDIAGVVAWGEA
jgi:CBS domain-containing protein